MTSFSGRISAPQEADTFSLTLRAGQQYAVAVAGTLILGLGDPKVTVRQGNHTVASDDDSGPGLQPYLTLEPHRTARYTFEITGYGSSTGSYVLTVLNDDFRNAFDGGGSAGLLTAARPLHGAIDYGSDVDVVTTTLIDGLSYTFDLRGSSTQDGSLGDPKLLLRSSAGVQLVSDDDSGDGLNSRINFTAEHSGRHFLEAGAYGSATGDYRLAISAGHGSEGGDHVRGTSVGDAIEGMGGADRISGAGGNDTLKGGAGNDVLSGGAGEDLLIGGPGHDRFDFDALSESRPGSHDTIRGGDGAAAFETGDLIDLTDMDANAEEAGDQSFLFDGERGVGHLWVTNVGEATLVRGNVDGDAGAEFELRIEDGDVIAAVYSADDFLL